jgi:hypothetical protein
MRVHRQLPYFRFSQSGSQRIGGGARLALVPRSHHIASAILVRGQKRAPLLHQFGYAWLGGIERVLRTLRIVCYDPLGITGPLRIGEPVFVGHLDDWAVFLALKVTLRALRMAPVCALRILPPLKGGPGGVR